MGVTTSVSRLIRSFAAIATLLFFASPLLAEEQRSVIIILMDALRPDHLQTYGYQRATSPEILRFSRRSAVFTNAYSAASWTRPSIESLLTGEYPSELSSNPGGGVPLAGRHAGLATVLKSYGYRTGVFYNTAQMTPQLMNLTDFDAYVDYGGTAGVDLHHAFVARGVDQAIDFLKSSSQPTFLFLHILDPHMPYEPPVNLFGSTPVLKFLTPMDWIRDAVPDCAKNRNAECHIALDPSAAGQMEELYDSEIAAVDHELGRLFRF